MMASKEKIYIASDHAGFVLKGKIAAAMAEWGYQVDDLGPQTDARVDYPDFANKLAQAIKSSPAPAPDCMGVLICGSGIGISIAANRHSWIRAAVCYDIETARLARQHNDANVIAFGERLIKEEVALKALKVFLETEFEGGRHVGRIEKLSFQ